MKNSILNLGKVLNKSQQKDILGGTIYPICECDAFGTIINQPCEGACVVKDPQPLSLCDVFPSLC